MASSKEEEYVHKVYNEIASHFSQTRYKPWPIVTKFLNDQTMGSIGIDVGCGNGKYLNVNPNVFIIGSDRSDGLISCAHDINNDYNVLVADGMNLPHRNDTFDFAISIAVVHHWTTRERRIQAINHIMSKVKVGGELLIYCWALEQGSSRRGYHEGMEQDVLIPWVLQEKNKESSKQTQGKKKKNIAKPDLTGIPPHERATFMAKWKEEQEKIRQAELEKLKKESKKDEEKADATKYRFYHLYREGELEEDCISAGAEVVSTGYEKDNWYVIAKKVL
ncbi:tRNA (carboxymethyluridine(34)-5-O)-methyltransferase [Monosporozyma servazzii]